jgi:hypothetical protein
MRSCNLRAGCYDLIMYMGEEVKKELKTKSQDSNTGTEDSQGNIIVHQRKLG